MIDKVDSRLFSIVIAALIAGEAKSAVKYLSDRLIVRATWRNKPNKTFKRNEIVVTYGAPNYEEREFIKKCKKAGEPFPVKKIQFRYYPKKAK